ncbi:polyketide cyclase /reductase [Pseudonocardia sp. TMWB2A]|uniref:SRPBCC family protein n=1 Tax=Pseudonocardia sp. TMWB2A TaxID=687430 RepID=UPI00307F3418
MTTSSSPRAATRWAVPLVVTAVIGVAACAPAAPPAPPTTTAAAAPGQTSGLTCDGAGVDPAATIRYGSERLIKAPLDRIWDLQTDVERYPTWQTAVATIERLDGDRPLQPGSQFRWTTPIPATPATPATTLTVTSSLQQVEKESCLRWTGPAVGTGLNIDEGTHVWTFTPADGGVLVRTEETWTGAQVEADVPLATSALGAGLETWLDELTTAAEGSAPR